MKKTMILEDWEIHDYAAASYPADIREIQCRMQKDTDAWIPVKGAIQVQMALMEKGIISDSLLEDGDTRYCDWVMEKDWAYRCTFEKPEGAPVFLVFKGVDTVADIFLNGTYLGQTRSMYLYYRYDISGILEESNTLLVYFHSNTKMLRYYEDTMPQEWKGNVLPSVMLRKSDDYAAVYGYKPIGLFDDVLLEVEDAADIKWADMRTDFNLDYSLATVALSAEGTCYEESGNELEMEFCIEEETGAHVQRSRGKVSCDKAGWRANTVFQIPSPKLWWPRNYGGQPLYKVSYTLYKKNQPCDQVNKITGLREVKKVGEMRFLVNGVEIRWWGADIAPIYGATNKYNEAAARDLAEKAYHANFNGMRVWGPSKPYPDSFYEWFDRAGIMLWQDMPTGGCQLPDTREYVDLYRAEAEQLVRRLKMHPSIMLWCGGNEHEYMCELHDNPSRIGFDTIRYEYREVCNRLDPQRYYHTSCPYDGYFTNDPQHGDTHGSRAYRKYIPGEDYGVFFSEDIRVYPPQYKSAKRFMKEDIWEEGYTDTKPFGCIYPMPKGWKKHLANNSLDMGHLKFGRIEEYYSATNVKELIYKHTDAAAREMYEMILRSRTGNPPEKSTQPRNCTGRMFWKYNDPWPHYYCSMYDYYGECNTTYYAARRGYEPFLIHLEAKNHIYLWGVNDTRKDYIGTVRIRVYSLEKKCILKEKEFAAAVAPGRSVLLDTLDDLCPLPWTAIVFAEFISPDGKQLSRTHTFLTKENMLPFPNAEIQMQYEDGALTITADDFARCVILSGNEDGDEFGWFFEDNYFDLLPFETKKVRILGRHKKGSVQAKAQYSDKITTIHLS